MFYIIAVFSVLIAALSQMLLKKGAMCRHDNILLDYLNVWVISGYVILGCSLLINVYALSLGLKVKEISIIESLSYLFVPLFSHLFFREDFSVRKIVSIAIIIIGIVVFFL